jgi:hypothetical protein
MQGIAKGFLPYSTFMDHWGNDQLPIQILTTGIEIDPNVEEL